MKNQEGMSQQSMPEGELLTFESSIEREKRALREAVETLTKEEETLLKTYRDIEKQQEELRDKKTKVENELAAVLFSIEIDGSDMRSSKMADAIKTSGNVVDFSERGKQQPRKQESIEHLNDTLITLEGEENELTQRLGAVTSQKKEVQGKIMSLKGELSRLETAPQNPTLASGGGAEVIRFPEKKQKI
jgi:chromosome segregation ATPase